MDNIKKVSKLLGEYKVQQFIILLLLLFQLLLSILSPILIKLLIDEITTTLRYELIIKIGVILLAVGIISTIVGGVQNYYWHYLRYSAINTLRYKVFENTLNKNVSFFNEIASGDITSRILDDTTILAQTVVIGMPMLIYNILNIISILSIMFIFSPILSFIVIIFIPIYIIVFNKINKSIRVNSVKERENYSVLMQNIQQNILGIRSIKFNNKENFFSQKFSLLLKKHLKSQKIILLFNTIGNSCTDFIVTITPIIVLITGAILVLNQKITLGTLLAFYSYLGYIYAPLDNLSDYYLGLQSAIGTSQRIIDFLNQHNKDATNESILLTKISDIEFSNVSFSYKGTHNILEKLNFKINQGDVVALVGDSGKGKSTVLNLLMRVYDPDQGEILINNTKSNNYTIEELYSKVSFIDQFPFIFNSSIKENIMFDNDINEEKLDIVFSITKVDEAIKELDKDLKFEILECGKNISGGQKQRICLSRALLKNFDILILDEALSALDYSAAKQIMNNLIRYVKDHQKIMLIVTHDKELLNLCDKKIYI